MTTEKTETEGWMAETTPYGVTQTEGGYAVKQIWWDQIVSPVYKTEEEAREELVKIAKERGCYRRVRVRRGKREKAQ